MDNIDSTTFLSRIWPQKLLRQETLELRAINRLENKIRREFLPSIDEFLGAAARYGDGWDIYFGVSTRFEKGGKKEDCYRVQCVWVDLDEEIETDFDPAPPDIIVKSGGGSHIYWLLNEPIYLRSGKWQEIEAVNRALCKKFSGDIAAIDITRILRVPGFLNNKYTPPRMTRAYNVSAERV